MDLYVDNILEHFRHPMHKEPLQDAAVEHREVNVSCGDEITLQLQITDHVISAVGWQGTGCAISQAAMSMLADELVGMPITEASALSSTDIGDLLGVPISARRIKCAYLCLHTLKNTLHSLAGEPVQSWLETVDIADE